MKNFIFSHKSDIDGLGNIILLKLAYNNIDYELCETFDINEKFEYYYNNKLLDNYDKIYITDLCLDKKHLDMINDDSNIKAKIKLIDHHKSVEGFDSYDFTRIKVKNEKGLCCATSLFYEYLVENDFLKANKALDKFCELTRRYDTWEWKNIYNDEMARNLSLVFESVGAEKYIDIMYKKLKSEEIFEFSDVEQALIDSRKDKMLEKVESYVKNIVYKDMFGLKAGIVFISYEYRNEVAQYLIDKDYDIDFVMLISVEHGTISYRSIRPGSNVRIVAENMGGKGHDSAAGSNLTKEQMESILNLILNHKI